jgi:hypothetical protein
MRKLNRAAGPVDRAAHRRQADRAWGRDQAWVDLVALVALAGR